MKKSKFILSSLGLFSTLIALAQTPKPVAHFDKVIVSPHIRVTFVQGDEESVAIREAQVEPGKIHIEVNSHTLRIYLEGAKEITKSKKVHEDGYKTREPIYEGTQVTAVVTYKTLDALSIRGEESHVCESPLRGEDFDIKLYGESNLLIREAHLESLHATIYGESHLEFSKGSIADQHYTAYGESTIDCLGIQGTTGKITAFGESEFKLNVSDEIKLVAFGEARLAYKGGARINKQLHIGELEISRID